MQTEPHPPFSRVVLTGYMGCGKTTVGRLLAHQLGWLFADLDEVIATGEGLTVPQIFAERGEAVFREMEGRYLATLLQKDHVVIALGGGAPETEALRTMLQHSENTAVVFLFGAFDTLYARCVRQEEDPAATARPLLGTQTGSYHRYAERQTVYAAIATHTVDVGSIDTGEVVEAVLHLFHVPDGSAMKKGEAS